MKDQAIVIEALNEAGQIIAEYLEPGPRNAEQTINQLIKTLDNRQLAGALERLQKVVGTIIRDYEAFHSAEKRA
jgi:hypothetical protein